MTRAAVHADLDPELERRLAERLDALDLTPTERAEALCAALGFGCGISAAASGVSPASVRARRRSIERKLALRGPRPAAGGAPTALAPARRR